MYIYTIILKFLSCRRISGINFFQFPSEIYSFPSKTSTLREKYQLKICQLALDITFLIIPPEE